jgi:hypothetical protein
VWLWGRAEHLPKRLVEAAFRFLLFGGLKRLIDHDKVILWPTTEAKQAHLPQGIIHT